MTDNSIDFDALRERYRQERDLRSAHDNHERQYRDVEDGFSHLLADPYGQAPDRAPLTDEIDVLIVGAGFGGLLTAARLREAGVAKIRIVDVASDVGGTWYWNRYPGAACDVESYIYLPLLEETGYMPVERYSKASEIREHSQRIAHHFDLYRDALFSTQVTSLDWDGPALRWRVGTSRGDRMTARFVVLTTGPLNRPKLPDIPGANSFAGHSFHTSRWDYDYTGGSATTPLDKLSDKIVGIIGTGATAVQCVPPLARSAKQLFVFQRTPSSVDARNNQPTDAEWVKGLKPGWQQRRMENFSAQFTQELPATDEVADGWTVLAAAVRRKLMEEEGVPNPAALLEAADLEKMVEVRERIETIVKDPETAAALKPWFSLYCKRPCFHDEYLQSFNRPNVTLVDTAGRGVERITPEGVVVGGTEYKLDCLVFSTGFEVATSLEKRAGVSIHGVNGQTLADKWKDGMATLHGFWTRGFPNLFVVSQAQSGMSVNFPHMLSEQARHIAHVVATCMAQGINSIEPTAEAEQQWTDMIVAQGAARRAFLATCTPGYYNNEGRASNAAARSGVYEAGPLNFQRLLKAWREEGELTGLERNGAHAALRGEQAA